jgi:hypothetical protein
MMENYNNLFKVVTGNQASAIRKEKIILHTQINILIIMIKIKNKKTLQIRFQKEVKRVKKKKVKTQ